MQAFSLYLTSDDLQLAYQCKSTTAQQAPPTRFLEGFFDSERCPSDGRQPLGPSLPPDGWCVCFLITRCLPQPLWDSCSQHLRVRRYARARHAALFTRLAAATCQDERGRARPHTKLYAEGFMHHLTLTNICNIVRQNISPPLPPTLILEG